MWEQEEQERNRRILAALEGEKQDLASRHERLSVMLDQTKVCSSSTIRGLQSSNSRHLRALILIGDRTVSSALAW